MKYIVMETFTSYAVLLDEEGRFVKAANLNYEVGQTVKKPVLMRDAPPAGQPQDTSAPVEVDDANGDDTDDDEDDDDTDDDDD